MPNTCIKMEGQSRFLRTGILNICGQSGLKAPKQAQIEHFIKTHKLDIALLQEAHLDDDTFKKCSYLYNNYNFISNNAPSHYGTACIVKSDLEVTGIRKDELGRAITFQVCGIKVANAYLHSGSSAAARSGRESYCSSVLPALLADRGRRQLEGGLLAGDFNCVTDKKDCSANAAAKHSSSLSKLVRVWGMGDLYRTLHPGGTAASRVYKVAGVEGAGRSRIDRIYGWGRVRAVEAYYAPLCFSDHFGHVVVVELRDP